MFNSVLVSGKGYLASPSSVGQGRTWWWYTMDPAERLASKQKQISISEFFEKNKHFLGFDTLQRSIITAVKEAVDLSLIHI